MTNRPSENGDRLAEFMSLAHGQLLRLAENRLRCEHGAHPLQPAALVNEVYLKFDRQNGMDIQSRIHFLALSAMAMRHVLVDHARQRKALKRGGEALMVTLDEAAIADDGRGQDMLDLHRALEKLAQLDPTEASIVEMRFFAGLTEVEIARELKISERTVRNQWSHAKAWLRRELA